MLIDCFERGLGRVFSLIIPLVKKTVVFVRFQDGYILAKNDAFLDV